MRFRRHVPTRPDWLEWLRSRWGRQHEGAAVGVAEPKTAEPAEERSAPPPPVPTAPRSEPDQVPPAEGVLGATPWRWQLSPRHRWALAVTAVFGGAFLLGYLVAVFVLFPAPIFAATKSVPTLLGLSQSAAEQRLEEGGLLLGNVERTSHPKASPGQVIWQDPPANVAVPEGTMVRLTVSGGPQRVPVPDLLGYDASVARQLLDAAGLAVGRVDSTQAPVPRGVVVTTRPATGTTVLPGATVTLVVSVGAPTIRVPDLSGLTTEEAGIILQQVGLSLGSSFRRASPRIPPGTIVDQTPAPGTLSAPGTLVNIFVARPPSR